MQDEIREAIVRYNSEQDRRTQALVAALKAHAAATTVHNPGIIGEFFSDAERLARECGW